MDEPHEPWHLDDPFCAGPLCVSAGDGATWILCAGHLDPDVAVADAFDEAREQFGARAAGRWLSTAGGIDGLCGYVSYNWVSLEADELHFVEANHTGARTVTVVPWLSPET